MKLLNSAFAFFGAAALAVLPASAQAPDSTEPMGQEFGEEADDTLRVLLAGAGSSHDFPKFFLGADAETLRKAGGLDVAATPNLEEALELIKDADVIVFSGNHPQWGGREFQRALKRHADAKKGVVILHAGAWIHPWDGYNERYVGGGSTSHGYGEFEVNVKKPDHPIMEGVDGSFNITDESYRQQFGDRAKYEVLAENTDNGETHASVWVMDDRRAPIAVITLGHAAEAHDNENYQKILVNAVKWAGSQE